MAETQNIAAMADKVADEVFAVFGWKQHGPKNHNWACSQEDHGKKTHPSDVVFYYDDVYTHDRVYVSTDLKSYSKKKISAQQLLPSIRSLAQSVECANSGSEWRKSYVGEDTNWRCEGLLFIHNQTGGGRNRTTGAQI